MCMVLFEVIMKGAADYEKEEPMYVSKVKQFFEFFVEGDAQNQCQFCCRVELPCFNGADGVARHADHLGKLAL